MSFSLKKEDKAVLCPALSSRDKEEREITLPQVNTQSMYGDNFLLNCRLEGGAPGPLKGE